MTSIDASSDEKAPANSELLNTDCRNTRWLVDSGASHHCTSERSVFMSYAPSDVRLQTIRVANQDEVKILGQGDVCFRTSRGVDLVLRDVWHAPGLSGSYISVSALDEQGYTNFFDRGKYKLTRGSLTVAEAEKIDKKYFVEGTLKSEEDPLSDLWHKRLDHLNLSGVQNLIEKNLLPGLDGSTTDHCFYCPFGRLVEHSCEKSDALKLVYIDLLGPFQKPSLNGSLYFVTFIDDFSTKIWCYALKSKCQVLEAFKEFRSYAEGHTGKKVNCVFNDRGNDYSRALDAYCTRHDIRYLSMSPGAASVNNVAETTNKNLMTKILSLLANAKLPWSYWDMALSAIVHVVNLCPVASLNNDVPDRVWFGHYPSYDHLRVFGCRALVHINEKSKGDDPCKIRECVFVGYAEDGSGYKLYDPLKMEVIYSRNVDFFEDQTICDVNRGKEEGSGGTSSASRPVPSVSPGAMKRGVVEYLRKFIHTKKHQCNS